MPYTHFTEDEKIVLQVMPAMNLPVCHAAAILGKHPGSVCREPARSSVIRGEGKVIPEKKPGAMPKNGGLNPKGSPRPVILA
jgi:IS30 family transposase